MLLRSLLVVVLVKVVTVPIVGGGLMIVSGLCFLMAITTGCAVLPVCDDAEATIVSCLNTTGLLLLMCAATGLGFG